MLYALGNSLESTLGSFPFLFVVRCFAFSLKLIIFIILIRKLIKTRATQISSSLLLIVLFGAIFEDIAWMSKLIHALFFYGMSYQPVLFITRTAWAFTVAQYQALALFIESLVQKPFKLVLRQKIFLITSCCFIIYFTCLAIFCSHKFEPEQRKFWEFTMFRIASLYMLLPLMFSSIFFSIKKLHTKKIPRILKKQLAIFIKAVITPLLISDFIQTCPSNLSSSWINYWVTNSYALVSISSILLTYAIFYCARKMMDLRFLNLQTHIYSPEQFNFINNFKDVFEQLNNAISLQELVHITQTLFKEAFAIPARSITLYLRSFDAKSVWEDSDYDKTIIKEKIETVINSDETELSSTIKKSKILIYDELDFSNFYEENLSTIAALQFLDSINADIFLPIYKHQKIIAYIIIERYARPHQFYSETERNEMLVLANYLSTILNLMQNRNLNTILAKEKEMHEELYSKHKEIDQYKETIRSFLRHTKQREIGILFYKNRRFVFGNRSAKEFVGINPNNQEGHQLTKTLRQLARDVENYKSAQKTFVHDNHRNKLVLSAVHNLEHNNVIILVYYPEVSDLLAKQIELLKDPSKWDYLLYLETTESGCLINQLIPGTGEKLLQFKISLLKTALSNKATLLQLPQEDLKPTVELLHHISLRTNLHILNVQAPQQSIDIAIKLFGINPLFEINNKEESLLKKLDGSGTLFIQNIHFLNIETQKHLAELIRFGFYRIFKSEQRVNCNVRIICSTNQDLKVLSDEGTFSAELLAELQKTHVSMPSLLTLPEEEFNELATGYSEQTLKTQAFKPFLELTEKERKKLIFNRPMSLQELKIKIQQLLIQKSKKNQIYEETLFDPAYAINDPQLIEAARLGKQALKDSQIMAMLWNKFKNQNKIATFLGVNRSSVNRRCKEYNLI